MSRELSIYIHIPFCKKKCIYCDFLSFGECDIIRQREYVDALCKEIGAYSLIAEDYSVVTIFVGGGTPSYIPAEYIGKILNKVRKTFTVSADAEITIEGNPDSLTADKIGEYRKLGINRLSIGLQSTNDDMLKTLGRAHNYDQFIAAYSRAREAGFSNINIDIMSGLPGESMESYVKTLGKVVELSPEHISAYSLIVEDGTPLADDVDLLSKLPSEEMDRKQYARTKLLLGGAGYNRYEISNYARTGYECRHNLRYWTGGEYLGVGLGASSYMKLSIGKDYDTTFIDIEDEYGDDYEYELQHEYGDDKDIKLYEDNEVAGNLTAVRFKGIDNIDEYIGRFSKLGTGWTDVSSIAEYINNCYTAIHVQKEKDEIEEFMFLGLRCISGIDCREFEKRFGKDIREMYGAVIDKYVSSGYLVVDGERLHLSDKGLDVSNTIMAEFML
ncbi:MAG: radical SAM family heme chaperone HemW [Lachnospiraceae bacterium]|nr:radical SAM family heme chaperone HemW [Lachnospiraceae bacterium]